MEGKERKKIRDNLKYNRFRGKEAAREYLKGLYERKFKNETTNINDLINQVLHKERVNDIRPNR